MYEKILEKLKSQRGTTSNVSDRSLEDLAKSLGTIITTDELLTAADLSAAITSIDGNISHYTAEQIKKINADKTVEEQRLAKEKADKEAAEKLAREKGDGGQSDIAKLIQDAVSPIVAELNNLKTEKVTQSRGEILNGILKETPEIYRNATLKGFDRMQFATEEDFAAYTEEVKTDAKAAIQEGQEKGLNTHAPSSNPKPVDKDEVSPDMQKAIEGLTGKKEEKDKPF